MSYITEVEGPEAKTSKQKLKKQKLKFDELNAERIAFEASGGGASSTTRLDNDEEVEFARGDQYVGINDIKYGGEECLLFNWASTTKKRSNCAMVTVVKPSGATETKGRALEGEIAAHNLCVVSDPRAKAQLQEMLDPNGSKYLAFGIGGEYRDPQDKRGKADSFDGVK